MLNASSKQRQPQKHKLKKNRSLASKNITRLSKHNHRRDAGGAPSRSADRIDAWRRELLEMPGFETEEQAIEEDRLRLERAEWVLPIEPPLGWHNIGPKLKLAEHGQRVYPAPRIDRAELLGLMGKWRNGIEGGARPTTLASSIAMRTVRLSVIPALLAAFDGYRDEELAVVTIVKPGWAMTPEKLQATSALTIKRQFTQDLKRTGVASFPGPLIGFLHGEFEPTSRRYILHYHIVTTAQKAAVLKSRLEALKYAYRAKPSIKRPIKTPKLRDRLRQLSYLVKSFWPARAVRMTERGERRDRNYHRIKEPASTVYLMWLNRQCLADLTIVNGGWSCRKGGSAAMRRFYLSVFMHGRQK